MAKFAPSFSTRNFSECINHGTTNVLQKEGRRMEYMTFRVAGTTYETASGQSRQEELRKLKFRDPPYDNEDGKVNLEIIPTTYDNASAFEIHIDGFHFGYIPKDFIQAFSEKMIRFDRVTNAEVIGGGYNKDTGEQLNYGLEITIRFFTDGRVRCQECSAVMDGGAYCEKCGAKLPHYDPIQEEKPIRQKECPTPNEVIYVKSADRPNDVSRKSRTVALLLCVFFGYFGLHRLYLGKIGTGLLYMFTFGLSGIGWLIDIVLIAVGSATDAGGRFVRDWDPGKYDRPASDGNDAPSNDDQMRMHRTIRTIALAAVVLAIVGSVIVGLIERLF